MHDHDHDSDTPVPWEVLGPVIAWMARHGVDYLRLIARQLPAPAEEDPVRDETRSLLYCEEEPDAPGLLNIYEVCDEAGQGRLNGPSQVPQAVLRPLLRALDEASVSEILISSSVDPAMEPDEGTTLTAVAELEDQFEEHEVPRADEWPVLIAVQVVAGSARD